MQLVGPGPPGRQRPGQPLLALADEVPVPPAAILVRQRHQVPAPVQARRPPRVGEQQQGEQPRDLGFGREQPGQLTGQPDGLVAQLPADQRLPVGGHVPLGEDQVDDAQHRVEPPGELVPARHPERDPGLADLPLRPHQPLGHRRLRDQEGGGDFRGGQPADAAQRQRHPHLRVQRRVTAHEDEPELVIAAGPRLAGTWLAEARVAEARVAEAKVAEARVAEALLAEVAHRLGLLPRPPALPPQPVQRLVPRRAGQPPAGVGRHPGDRPLRHREQAGVLHRVLGGLQIPEHPGDRGYRPPPAVTEQVRVVLAQRSAPFSSATTTPSARHRPVSPRLIACHPPRSVSSSVVERRGTGSTAGRRSFSVLHFPDRRKRRRRGAAGLPGREPRVF